MTISRLKPDKPHRQPKEGSKEAALREKREQNTKQMKKAKPAKLAEPAAVAATEAEAPAPAELKESNVRTTTSKKSAKTKARTPVNGKTDGVRPGSKVELIAKLLKRANGCTTADVLKACDWPSVSMPAQAKAAGLKLKKEKDGKVTRYYAA